MIINILDLSSYTPIQKKFVDYVFKTFSTTLLNDVEFLLNIDTIIKITEPGIMIREFKTAIDQALLKSSETLSSDNKSENKNILIESNHDLKKLYNKKNMRKVDSYYAANPDFKAAIEIADNTDNFLRNLDIISSDPHNFDKIKELYPRYKKFIYPTKGGSRKTRKAK
jgi:hypothetical protein